jgi:hypothetical protein
MQQIFTPELLIKHLYNETTPAEARAIAVALQNNPSLQEEFRHLEETKYRLDESEGGEPGQSTIQKILAYSGQSQMQPV